MTDLLAETLANPALGAIGTAILMAVVALWLAAAWWAYADAARRTESSLAGYVAAGWVILSTPLLLPLSLATYTFARPQLSAADRRTRTLAEQLGSTPELPTCAACAAPVDEAWLRCPSCKAWLAAPCAHCGGWSDANLQTCPWCGGDAREQPFVEHYPSAASALPRSRRRRVAWRATSPSVPRSQRRDGIRPAVAPGVPRSGTARVRP